MLAFWRGEQVQYGTRKARHCGSLEAIEEGEFDE